MQNDDGVSRLIIGLVEAPAPASDWHPGMLTISEVAALLHAHPNTIRQWTNSGRLKAYRVGPRGDRRFRHQDIESFLKASQL